jgi:hypothetical protein
MLEWLCSGSSVHLQIVTMKSQTLTTGSNIDHMIMSHDSSHDMSHERSYDSHMIDHMAYYMIRHMTIVGGEGQECNDLFQSFS